MPVQTVVIAISEGVLALDVAGPVDVFADANSFLASDDQYRVILVGKNRAPVIASNGMQLVPNLSYAEARDAYAMVLVAGGPADSEVGRNDELCAWLHCVVPDTTIYGSICTGAFAIGHAGLLDHRVVTTHWLHAPRLAALFPKARVEPDRIYVREGRLVTSAGVTAGIDLALALVAEYHGPRIALAVAKRLVVVARRQGGQSQFSPYLVAPTREGSPIAHIQAHVMENIGSSLSIRELSCIAGTSQRNLSRLFAQEAGVTPHAFVQLARIDVARNLLEGTNKPMKVIAYECGFGSHDQMRAVFAKVLGTSPAQYRASFSAVHTDSTIEP